MNNKTENKEEFDTSELAFIAYKIFYGTDEEIKTSKGRKFFELNKLNYSGETDFNFGPGWSHSISSKFKGYLGEISNSYKKYYENRLEKCKSLYKTIVNISLMPQTGNLQSSKKGLGNDRFDTYIWALNSYYEGETSLLFNNASFQNMELLKKHFELFRTDNDDIDSIHIYCSRIYGIPKDSQLVDELILSGKEAIDSPEKVIEYMNLAYKFWGFKLKHIQDMLVKNKKLLPKDKEKIINNEVKKAQEILNGWFDKTDCFDIEITHDSLNSEK